MEVKFNVTPVTGETMHHPKFKYGGDSHPGKLKGLAQTSAHPNLSSRAMRLYMRSLVDVAALRFRPDTMSEYALPAAGLPWFMALFGRDSLITSYQMMPFNSGAGSHHSQGARGNPGEEEVELTEEEPGRSFTSCVSAR